MQHNRRSFLCAGGAAILSAMSRGPAAAQLGQVDVPSVEWLAVRIVAVTNRPPVEHKAEPKNSRDSQASAFQLAISPSNYFDREVAIHVQSASGPDMRNFLIDPCSDPRVLLEHMDQFRIEPDSLDALVLSNGNQRHLRALHDFLNATNGSLKKGMDVIIGREALTMNSAETASLIEFVSDKVLSVVDTNRSRIVAGQSLVVGSDRIDSKRLHSDDMTAIASREYWLESPDAAPLSQTVSTSFVLVEKGLVIITSSNEGAANSIRAAQAASEVRDVHAIIAMNIGVDAAKKDVRTTLSELYEFDPAYIVVSDGISDEDCNLAHAAGSGKLVRCSAAARMVFRV